MDSMNAVRMLNRLEEAGWTFTEKERLTVLRELGKLDRLTDPDGTAAALLTARKGVKPDVVRLNDLLRKLNNGTDAVRVPAACCRLCNNGFVSVLDVPAWEAFGRPSSVPIVLPKHATRCTCQEGPGIRERLRELDECTDARRVTAELDVLALHLERLHSTTTDPWAFWGVERNTQLEAIR